LIVNGTLTDQPGLFYGKTGIAVFFFHYARQTGTELFQDYAVDLIEEIQKQITDTYPARYDTGLAGIGVGFEYFLQNGFLEADDDIFDDFDNRMYRAAMYEPYPDLSLQAGLSGWGRYFIYRLRSNKQINNKLHKALTHITRKMARMVAKKMISENEQPDVYRFFCDLKTIPEYADKYCNSLQKCKQWECVCKPDIQNTFPYMGKLQRLYTFQRYFSMDLAEEIEQEWEKWKETDINSIINMGLQNGLTAEGLLHLTFFHKGDLSWINLL
jgi:hypothetical protein